MPSSDRGGRYVMQPQGYRAFIPADLPPSPPLVFDDAAQHLLSEADLALGRLDGAIRTLPDVDQFTLMYVRKEAVLSSRIEGTRSSLDDVLRDEAGVPGKRPADIDEVRNYVAAMNHGLSLLPELPISVRLIKEVHRVLLTDVRGSERQPGEIRRSQNWIGFAGATLAQASFVPPPPEEVGPALARVERFIHDESPMPFLVKTALVHAQFETIHPFLDGNGRVGRLLLTLLLCDRGLLSRPVLYLSEYFVMNQLRYYDLLQGVHDRGAWEEWTSFYLRGVSEVAKRSADAAHAILELREAHRKLIATELGRGAASGLALLERLFSDPILNVNRVGESTRLTYRAAADLVEQFVRLGLLQEITGQARNRQFRYTPYVNIFEEQ
jgi:Fic family protein